jgi:hypothetical protein
VLDLIIPESSEVSVTDGNGKTVIVTILSVGPAVMTVVLVCGGMVEDTAGWLVPLPEVTKTDVLTPVPDGPVMMVVFEGMGKRGVPDFVIFDVMVGKAEEPPETVAFEGTGKRGVLVLTVVLFEVVGRTNEDEEPVKLVPAVIVEIFAVVGRTNEDEPVKLVPTVIVEVRTPVLGAPVPLESQNVVMFEGKGKGGVLVLVWILEEVMGSPDKVPVPVKLAIVEAVGELVTGMVIPPERVRVTLDVPGSGVTETPVPVPDVRPKIVVFDGIGGRLV